MLARSRTVKPFLSSTFTDFSDEREYLTKHIFPRFDKMCQDQVPAPRGNPLPLSAQYTRRRTFWSHQSRATMSPGAVAEM